MRIKDVQSGAIEDIPLMGVFVAIGHKPNTDLFVGQLEMEGQLPRHCLRPQGNATATSIPGVFAAGDVQDRNYRQACTSAGTGWPRWMPNATSTPLTPVDGMRRRGLRHAPPTR